MLLLILVLVSVALVPVFGGHPQSLAEIRLRSIGLLLAAVGLQAALVLFPGGANLIRIGAYIGSYVVAAGFLMRNSSIPGLWLIALGAGLNFSAIVANGGVMPAAPYAMAVAGLPLHLPVYSNSIPLEAPKLALLGDIFAIPASWPFSNVYSLGDICIAVGAIVTVHRVTGSRLVPTGAGRFFAIASERAAASRVVGRVLWAVGGWTLAGLLVLRAASSANSVNELSRHIWLLVVVGVAAFAGASAAIAVLAPRGGLPSWVSAVVRAVAVLSLIPPTPSLIHLAIVAGCLGATAPPLRRMRQPSELQVAFDASSVAATGFSICVATALAAVIGSWGAGGIMMLAMLPAAAAVVDLASPRPAARPSPAVLPPDRSTRALMTVGLVACAGLAAGVPLRLGTGANLLSAEPDVRSAIAALGLVGGVFGAGIFLGGIAAPALSGRVRAERLLAWCLVALALLLPVTATSALSRLLAVWLVAGVAVGTASVAGRIAARTTAARGSLQTMLAAATVGLLVGLDAARLLSGWLDVRTVLLAGSALLLVSAAAAPLSAEPSARQARTLESTG
jgi:hypothetical protein